MPDAIHLKIKTVSTNAMYRGRRYKSKEARQFEHDIALLLAVKARNTLPDGELCVHYRFGTSRRKDTDNNIKLLQDAICKHYGIDDSRFAAHTAVRVPVKKGEEFVTFCITPYRKEEFDMTVTQR